MPLVRPEHTARQTSNKNEIEKYNQSTWTTRCDCTSRKKNLHDHVEEIHLCFLFAVAHRESIALHSSGCFSFRARALARLLRKCTMMCTHVNRWNENYVKMHRSVGASNDGRVNLRHLLCFVRRSEECPRIFFLLYALFSIIRTNYSPIISILFMAVAWSRHKKENSLLFLFSQLISNTANK